MIRSTSKTGSSSCQFTTTLNGEQEEIQKYVNTIHRRLRVTLENTLAVIGLSWGLYQKRSGTELTLTDLTDHGIQSAENVMAIFSRSGHPIFRASSAFEKGELRSKEGGKKSIHPNGSNENIELLLRTVISANQLSICGTTADLCNEVPKLVRAPVKPAALDHVEEMEIPTNLSVAENSTNAQQWRNHVQEYQRKFEQLSEDQKLFKLCYDAGLRLVAQGQYFYTLDTEEGQQMQHLIRENTMPRNEKWTRIRGWILKNTRIGPVLNIKVCYHDDRYCIEVQIPSLFQDSTVSWVRIVNGVDKYVTESMLTTK